VDLVAEQPPTPPIQEEIMRIESSVTSVSWIPSEAISGIVRVPMDIGVGHYDDAPPDRVDNETLDQLVADDALRFGNRLGAWIDVEDGEIVDAGYSGRAVVGSTTAKVGIGSIRFPGVAYPVMAEEPVIEDGIARFVQTAGGRTGAPLPHRISRPPFVRITGPTAWTTLALEIGADGSSRSEVLGASPFPRHWIYDAEGALQAKSGVIDFTEWTKEHDFAHSPWHDVQAEALIADVESAVERSASKDLMSGDRAIRKLDPGTALTTQGEPGDELYLVLDGVFEVEVDGEIVAELGPGAIVGERAILEGGTRTSTVRAVTRAKVAASAPDAVDRDVLSQVAAGHRREEG
jgi:hypothetical protein